RLVPYTTLFRSDFGRAAADHRRALVYVHRRSVEDPLTGCRQRLAARLFHEHRHRIGFVHEAQLSGGRLLRRRIEKDPALEEDAMDVRHHRAGVAAGIALLLRLVEVVLITLRKTKAVA